MLDSDGYKSEYCASRLRALTEVFLLERVYG